MDEIVRQAMARWPDVPAARGWLRLDRRGRWHLVDRGAPGFDEALHGAGSPVAHAALKDFIARNYQADEHGCWYFQNGPQRVFVDLELAPLVLRVFEATQGDRHGVALVTHTGHAVGGVDAGRVDDAGNVWLRTDLGPAVVHDADLAALPVEQDEATGRSVLRLLSGDVPLEQAAADPADEWGFVRRPRA